MSSLERQARAWSRSSRRIVTSSGKGSSGAIHAEDGRHTLICAITARIFSDVGLPDAGGYFLLRGWFRGKKFTSCGYRRRLVAMNAFVRAPSQPAGITPCQAHTRRRLQRPGTTVGVSRSAFIASRWLVKGAPSRPPHTVVQGGEDTDENRRTCATMPPCQDLTERG